MKIIQQGDTMVQKVLGKKQVNPNNRYRLSHYTVFHTYDGLDYLFNNFTKMLVQLEGEIVDSNPDRRYTAEEISADMALTELVADGFLVPADKDEAKVYEDYCRLARAMKGKKGYSKFTILPTTACNARCVYCYEAGIPFVSMNEETVQQTIAFIKQVRDPQKPVQFSWFGGEPLMGEHTIDRITDALRADGIEVRSTMISNGSLITSDIVRKMREKWNLSQIQITLDGTEEQYNARKNYVFSYDSAYWHVLSRIKMINENGIYLVIRINIDHENADSVATMIEDLRSFLPDPSKVTFRVAPLFDLQEGENAKAIWEKSFAIADMIAESGFYAARGYRLKKTKTFFCMADNPYTALVITPEGKLYACEHVQEVECLGDIWNGITRPDLVEKAAMVEPAREECRDCFALPNCTTFTGCPNTKADCKYANRRQLERALDLAILRYQKHHAEIDDEEDIDC